MATETKKLAAGRQLDRLIGEKVMGCRVVRRKRGTYDLIIPGGVNAIDFVEPDAPWSAVPAYSTDIAAAWQVVEKVRICVWPTTNGRWFAFANEFETAYGDEYWFGGNSFMDEQGDEVADTAPLAICRAAILATCRAALKSDAGSDDTDAPSGRCRCGGTGRR